MGVSHQQQTTILHTCLFGAIKVYPSLKAFDIKYRSFPLEKRLRISIGHCIDIVEARKLVLVAGGIKHRGFSYDTG
ncbi:hypothetical protein O0I10_002965 [Lichtheimia ornata]|uniref:Uncharacterized protein n=1 Tax=Lichtheimia ornata TaxID=688661 RepID=A0AAD7VA23_9FUNG|nr:uncharacterized protein O0I10_002965 [Lichtheimia ornata]KAJ8661216.1 hypothetical protein O0I10_002965 [Lichtheimia ornata]